MYTQNEHGLSGIALDPESAENGKIYVYYSPAGLLESDFYFSRFTVGGGNWYRRVPSAAAPSRAKRGKGVVCLAENVITQKDLPLL